MTREAPRVRAHRHAVQFYGNASNLSTAVAGFLSEGLVAGQPAVLIATASHRRAILEQLVARLIDVEAARRLGDLVVLDAEDTLTTFMVGGLPDPTHFKKNVGDLLDQTLRGRERTQVRAYGEMVDVLWKKGAADAAILLECMWNDLASTHDFSLLCGYARNHFPNQGDQFQAVCDQHTHVFGAEPSLLPFKKPRRKLQTA